eukprot:3816847-Lingulodinium_polyedra.AAC.1
MRAGSAEERRAHLVQTARQQVGSPVDTPQQRVAHASTSPERSLPFEGREPVSAHNPERVAKRVAKGA